MTGEANGVVIGQIGGGSVQLVNTSGAAVDVSGWTVEDGIFRFVTLPPGSTIPAGGSLQVALPGDSDVVRLFRFDGTQVDGRRY